MHGIFMLLPLFLLVTWISAALRERAAHTAGQTAAADYGRRRTPSFESRVFRLAARHDGRLTVSDIVIETGMGIAEVEAAMERLADNQHVRVDVTERGTFEYEFPELSPGRWDGRRPSPYAQRETGEATGGNGSSGSI